MCDFFDKHGYPASVVSRLIWRELSIQQPLLFCVHVIFFCTAYRRELVAVFKVSCFRVWEHKLNFTGRGSEGCFITC